MSYAARRGPCMGVTGSAMNNSAKSTNVSFRSSYDEDQVLFSCPDRTSTGLDLIYLPAKGHLIGAGSLTLRFIPLVSNICSVGREKIGQTGVRTRDSLNLVRVRTATLPSQQPVVGGTINPNPVWVVTQDEQGQ
jgi:hypothetical protein